MKLFATIFALFFAAMSYVGYRQGAELVAQPNAVERLAFSNVRIEQSAEKYFLVYRYGEILLSFDVDTNKLRPNSIESIPGLTKTEGSPWRAFILSDPSLPGVMGGVTLGLSVKDILTKPALFKEMLSKEKEIRRKQILAAIFGSISGYWFGYTYATRNALPERNSEPVMVILRDEKKWIEQKRSVYANILLNLKYQVSRIDDPTFRGASDLILESAKAATVKKLQMGAEISSADFAALSRMAKVISPLYDDSMSRETVGDKIIAWMSWVMLALFSLMVAWLSYDAVKTWRGKRRADLIKLRSIDNN